MRKTDRVKEDSQAALTYGPLKRAEIEQLRDACRTVGPTFCTDCDVRCARAAGTVAALDVLTRFLTYHDQYGDRGGARRLYAAMPEDARDRAGADLDAARRACPNHLDSASLLPRIEHHLS